MSLIVKGAKREDYLNIAKELCDGTVENLKIHQLKELIIQSPAFDKDPVFVTNLLTTVMEERLEEKARQERLEEKSRQERLEEKARQERLEEKARQERLEEKAQARQQEKELEKIRLDHELELARIHNNCPDSRNRGNTERINHNLGIESETQIEKLIKSVKTLSRPVPSKAEDWNLFFLSIERAFQTKKVPEEAKAEILINILGEKVTNILINVTEEEIKDYGYMKKLVLKEYEPSPQYCLENFRKARRKVNETHVQFATRLIATFEYYCELRNVVDLKTLKELMVADKIFQTLDPDTATHISIRQGGNWLAPSELAKECDIYFESKGRSLSETHNASQRSSFNSRFHVGEHKYIPPPLRRDEARNRFNNDRGARNRECFNCKSMQHIAKFCPQRIRQGNQKRTDHRLTGFESNKDAIVAKVKSKYFGEEICNHPKIMDLQPLKYVTINIYGKDIEAIIDSGTQIPVLHPECINGLEREEYGMMVLSSAFGEETKAKVIKIPMAIREHRNGKLLAPIEIIGAITDKLRGPCLIPPEIYEMLKKENEIFANPENQTINIDESIEVHNKKTQKVKIGDVKAENEIIHYTKDNDYGESREENKKYYDPEDYRKEIID